MFLWLCLWFCTGRVVFLKSRFCFCGCNHFVVVCFSIFTFLYFCSYVFMVVGCVFIVVWLFFCGGTQPYHHKNTKAQIQKHHQKNTTTQLQKLQPHNNKNTRIKQQQTQKYHHKNTTIFGVVFLCFCGCLLGFCGSVFLSFCGCVFVMVWLCFYDGVVLLLW